MLRAEFLRNNARRCNRMGFAASASVTRCHISPSLSSIMEFRIVVFALYSFAPVHLSYDF